MSHFGRCGPAAVLIGCGLLLASGASRGQPSTPPFELRYVANAGVLLSFGTTKVLIDAPIRDGIRPYTAPPADERARLEGAQAPYESVAAILVTHWHEDHFSAEAVAEHLRHSRATLLISSEEVVGRVRSLAPELSPRLRPVTPRPGASESVTAGGLRVHVLGIRHNPARRLPQQHVGFLIEGTGTTALHVGDADPQADNFALLASLPRADLALVPYWFITSETTRTRILDTAIRARHLVGLHVPSADAPAVRRALSDARVTATLLDTPGIVPGLRR